MKKNRSKRKRVRTVIYIDPLLRKQLRREHADSDRYCGAIVEEALEAYFDAKSNPKHDALISV